MGAFRTTQSPPPEATRALSQPALWANGRKTLMLSRCVAFCVHTHTHTGLHYTHTHALKAVRTPACFCRTSRVGQGCIRLSAYSTVSTPYIQRVTLHAV